MVVRVFQDEQRPWILYAVYASSHDSDKKKSRVRLLDIWRKGLLILIID